MSDECLTKPCSVCGNRIQGANFCCPNCKTCVCFSCGIMEVLEKIDYPNCPKCGTRLK